MTIGFNAYADVRDVEEAHAEIARRVVEMQTAYNEMLEIAERFNIRVGFDLESDVIRGHNQAPYINWNPSAQHC